MTSDNTVKLVFDMAADGALRAADQVKKKFTQVGEEGGKAGDKLIQGLGKSLLTAAALVAAVKGVAEALNTAAASAAKLSKETGGRQLGAEISGQRLGLKSSQTASILNATGPRSADERSGFLSALANAKGPGGRPLDAGTALEAARIYGEGTVESSEILDALNKRGRGGLDALGQTSRERFAGLSDSARGEYAARTDEAAANLRVSDTAGQVGLDERKRLNDLEALRAEHPGAFAVQDAIGAATEKVGGRAIIEAGQRANFDLLDLTSVGVLRRIAEYVRPRLNSSANGP